MNDECVLNGMGLVPVARPPPKGWARGRRGGQRMKAAEAPGVNRECGIGLASGRARLWGPRKLRTYQRPAATPE